MARPIVWTEEKKAIAFEKIISQIFEGKSCRSILNSDREDLPSHRVFIEWLANDESLSKQYAYACEARAELKFESIEEDYIEEPQRDRETGRIDPAWVNLQRLKIDAKKWELAKMLPKKYGDRVEVDNQHSGSVNIISLGSGKNPNGTDL